MIWCEWKIEENWHVLVKQFHGNFRSKTLDCTKIKSIFRDVKWCFIALWGLKGLTLVLQRPYIDGFKLFPNKINTAEINQIDCYVINKVNVADVYFSSIVIFLVFEAGNCGGNFSFKWMKNRNNSAAQGLKVRHVFKQLLKRAINDYDCE